MCFELLFENLDPEAHGFRNELGDAPVGSTLFYQPFYVIDEFVVDGDTSVVSVWHGVPR